MISRNPIEAVGDEPQAIVLTKDERVHGLYSPETLGNVLSALHQDGLVLLKNVVDVGHIEAINKSICDGVEQILADAKQGFKHGVRSNFLQRPTVAESELLYEDVYFNPFVLQIANAEAIPFISGFVLYTHHSQATLAQANLQLANRQQCSHRHRRVAITCTQRQRFCTPAIPVLLHRQHPANGFNEANGATEFWLGSHAATGPADQHMATEEDLKTYPHCRLGQPVPRVTWAALASRRSIRLLLQPEYAEGDIVIRDIRMWHAGMPNGIDEHRIMLGLYYMSPRYPNFLQRCHLPES